jgi:hypothetical protein
MPTIRFEGAAGRQLWENVKHHLGLIRDAPLLRQMPDEERRIAEVRMVAFMVTAAWGYPWVSDQAYGTRVNRFLFLSRLNRLIYNVTYYHDDELVAEIEAGGVANRLHLGPAQGFSAVLPLTKQGYDDYMGNRLAATQLTGPHVVPYEQSIHNTDYIMITGAVHFPSLVTERRLDDPETIRISAFPVVAGLLRQIARFAPVLAIAGDDGESVYVKDDVFRPPPVLLCFISGRGAGEPMLRKAGFVREGEDRTGNRKYVLRTGGAYRRGEKLYLIKRIIFYQNNNCESHNNG